MPRNELLLRAVCLMHDATHSHNRGGLIRPRPHLGKVLHPPTLLLNRGTQRRQLGRQTTLLSCRGTLLLCLLCLLRLLCSQQLLQHLVRLPPLVVSLRHCHSAGPLHHANRFLPLGLQLPDAAAHFLRGGQGSGKQRQAVRARVRDSPSEGRLGSTLTLGGKLDC